MIRILIFALLLSFSNTIFSQEIKTDSLLTEKQNAEWIAEFEKLESKSEQIAELKKKIESDSIYYIGNTHFHNSGNERVEHQTFGAGKKIYESNCVCKIMFKLIVKSDEYLLDYSEFEHTYEILNLINNSNIEKITVYKNDLAPILFGQRAKCGGIILYSDNRKLKKKIKNVL
ncbi:hypothetical protein [Winogradskyella immobilis]|uniref:Uncharacterized protein n=1 Tax=Winogradskyella immobilis TaxID=2816852 RepID=A0ABS8EQX3_9FLAO|nr:hypothetical protein [Winogradskyella immobilis]MCC1485578.1 hypothetical protein [Winogradskyella immobilis]MCG0017670.1 hypothetical protein [Winogradskyella immobilis]